MEMKQQPKKENIFNQQKESMNIDSMLSKFVENEKRLYQHPSSVRRSVFKSNMEQIK